MPNSPHWKPQIRRRAVGVLLLMAVLVLASLFLVQRLQARVEVVHAALSAHVELYKLSRRVQGALVGEGAGEDRALELFRLQVGEFDRDLAGLDKLDLATGLSSFKNPELKFLVAGLASDWRAFRTAYQLLREAPVDLALAGRGAALVRTADDVQASVVAINFIAQRELARAFGDLDRAIVLIALADLVILAGLYRWLVRRVVHPVEQLTAAARRMAAAEFAVRVEVDAEDEIGQLSAVLNDAAGRVQDLLAKLGRDAGALAEAEAKFRVLAEESLVGVYMLQGGRLAYANPKLKAIFAHPAAAPAETLPIVALIEDSAPAAGRLQAVLGGTVAADHLELRARRCDGAPLWLEMTATATEFRGAKAVIGTVVDLTARKEADRQLRQLKRAVEQSPAVVVITGVDGRIEYVNPRFQKLTGYTAEEAIGQTPRLVNSGLTPPIVYAEMWQRLVAGEEWQGEILNRKKSGELFWEYMVASPVRDEEGAITHFIAVKEDVTARKQAESELRRVNRTLQVLSACNQSLVHAESVSTLLESICRNLVRLGGFPLACVAFADDAEARQVRLVACAGPAAEYAYHWSDEERGRGSSGESIRRKEMLIARDIAAEPDHANWRSEAKRYGLASSIAMPLLHGSEVRGVLRIYSGEVDAFTAEEVKLLAELAEDVTYGLAAFNTRDRLDAQATELAIRRRALESSRNGVLITVCDAGADHPIVYANAAFESITGYQRAEVLGKNARFLIGEHWDQPEIERLRDALRRGVEVEVTLRNVRRDGSMFWNDLSLSPVRDEQGRVTHVVSILNDVTDRVRYQQELQHHVTHDTLTGLANRTLLRDRIEQAVAHASRSARRAGVLLIALDRFKLINDSLGHAAGDELLRNVAARLSAVVRRGDTVARLGGDEFVVVLAELADRAEASRFAQAIEEAFLPSFAIEGQDAFVSASIGVSVGPDDGSSAELLLRNAEIAMYAVKGLGGEGFRVYQPDMAAVSRDRIGLETDLRRAIERGELKLFYQPKVRLADGAIVGAEALIRWAHPERGLVLPGQFIALAEETGLIGPIGDWVIEEALRHLSVWAEQELAVIKISVNLSARQFREQNLASRVRAMVVNAGVPAEWIELELTESMLMHRSEATVASLREISEAGIGLAIDDFGTGYSSLSYLQRFPIDTLKIDRSFVKDLETSHDSTVLAGTIVVMARNLGKSVVAEGVETVGQAEILRGLGCEVVQGFLYSRPVPEPEFREMLRSGRLQAA